MNYVDFSKCKRAKSSYNSWIISWESYRHLCYCRNIKACQRGGGAAEVVSRARGMTMPCVLGRSPGNIPTGDRYSGREGQPHFKCAHKPCACSRTSVAECKVADILHGTFCILIHSLSFRSSFSAPPPYKNTHLFPTLQRESDALTKQMFPKYDTLLTASSPLWDIRSP